MEIHQLAQRTVGEIVAEDFRRGAVLKRFGIDFCCGGGQSLAAACKKKEVSVSAVAQALEAAGRRGETPLARVTSWTPGFLAEYIVNEHHSYVRESIPVLRAFTQKVARVHGGACPELVDIAIHFDAVAREMEAHMASEERVVFPRIKALADNVRSSQVGDRSLRELIDDMESEHEEAGMLMREIRKLSADYRPPEWACNTYRAAFAKLEEFEEDLHRHVHLENNVLFPKALALSNGSASKHVLR
jgi:regulator of cell morphogenesis and NO signaling